jgi:hypothetical protein
MTQEVSEAFTQFLREPSLETFTATRRLLVGHPAYAPYSQDLIEMSHCHENEQFDRVMEIFRDSMPNLILSPRAHLLSGIALREGGQEDPAKMEMAICHLCIDGIRMTGDGSQKRPFLVTRISDEYDLLMAMDKEMEMQALEESGGRQLDCLTLKGGTQLHFDVTDCMGRLQS